MGLDPQISSCVNLLKSAVLAQGIEVVAIKDEDQEVAALGTPINGKSPTRKVKGTSKKAQEIADFCKWNLDRMPRPIHSIVWEMLDSICVGNRLAEQVYDYSTWNNSTKLCLAAIKPKPRRSVSFVVDVYYNVLGIIGLIPGQGAPVLVESIIGEPGQIPNLLPRKKFVVFTNRGESGDPRGQSDLRPAYNSWWMKMQTLGEYLKYIAQFAGPSLWATAPEGASTYVDPITGAVLQPEQVMLTNLLQLRNGSVSCFPYGSEVHALDMKGTGEPFLACIDLCDRQATKSILYQTLATEEGVHQARAASETHQDILGLRVLTIKRNTADIIKRDILKPLVEYNYGLDAAENLTPDVSLGETEQQDQSDVMKAIATLVTAGFMHTSQFAETDRMIGLPERDVEAQNAEIAAEKAALDPALLATDTGQQTDKLLAKQQGKKVVGRLGSEVDT
jgi:hypothetical protein